MNKVIIPAILETDFDEVEKKLNRIKDEVSWVQIDVIDGEFTKGRTFELELITRASEIYDKFLYDIHLMVKEPLAWINKAMFVNASRIIGHVEMMSNRNEFISRIKDEGIEAGLAFDTNTEINDNIPEDTDVILLMGRKAGFGSLPLDEDIYSRVQELNNIRKNRGLSFKIAVDGGIAIENIGDLSSAGVDIFYCTSSVFNGNIKENIDKLEEYAVKG